MTPGSKRRLALITAVAALALFLLQRGNAPAVNKSPTTTPAPQAGANRSLESTAARLNAPAAEAPARLPAYNAPLAIIMEPLAARADTGDAKAACRLAMELIRCQGVEENQRFPGVSDAEEAELEAKGKLDAADQAAKFKLYSLLAAQECLAVPDRLRGRAAHYLGQAARAGEPEAMVRYVDLNFWPLDARGVFADPEFDRWRRDAPGLLHRAFAAGVPESASTMFDAYQNDFGGVGSMIANDPVKSEALRLLMTRLHGWRDRGNNSGLDAASLARASELAKQWHEGPFKGRNYLGQDRTMFQLAAFAKRGGAPHEFCTSDTLIP